ncbi:tetratricopeptide repeat protein, partial [Pseudoglutamicibacter cumminsii]
MVSGEGSRLVGPHVDLVQKLVDRLDALTDDNESAPQVVVLRGESGVGKSRIVREFYSRLCDRQPKPAFWPPITSPDGHTGANPLADRKVLGPPLDDFVWPPNALPSFGWWTFNCERLQSTLQGNLLAEKQAELAQWIPPLAQAWAQQAGRWDRALAKRKDAAILLRDAAVGEVTDASLDLLQDLLNVTVPAIGTMASWVWKAGKAGKRRRAERQDRIKEIHLGQRSATRREEVAGQLADSIRGVTHPTLPGVVVVEDAHRLTEDLGVFLQNLAEPKKNQPVLVVLTVWPEGELNPVWDDWLDAIVDAGHGEVWEVPRLGGADLATLIRSHAPHVTEADTEALTAVLSTPLMVEMWITSPKIQRRIKRYNGALPVDEDVLKGIPRTLAEVYRQRWEELPYEVKEALKAAVALTDKNDVPVFLSEIVTKAAAFMVDQDDLARGLELAADPAAWTMIHQQVDAFREAPLARQARAALDLDHDDEIELRQAAVTELHLWITERLEGDYWLPDSATTSVAAEWLVSLNPNRFDTPADVAAAWLHAGNLADAFQYQSATELLSRAINHCPLEHTQVIDMRLNLGVWLNEQGQVQDAIECLQALATDTQRVLGPDHPDTLTTRNNLAYAYLSAGDLKRAIPLFEQTLTHRERVLGPDHPDTLASGSNLAHAYLSAGDLKRPIPLYEQTLTDYERVLGPDHPDTLASRSNLAYAYLSAGDLKRAIPLYEQTLTDYERVLGLDHPDTLTSRSNLAYVYQAAGDLKRAIPLSEQIFTDRVRVLGLDHPDTLASRNNLAGAYESAEDLARAIPLFANTLTDSERVLGPDHPFTLTTRNNLAAAYRSAGDLDQAIPLYEQNLTDRVRVLGPDHPSTLASRNDLAYVYQAAGDLKRAIPLYEQTLTDSERALGPD